MYFSWIGLSVHRQSLYVNDRLCRLVEFVEGEVLTVIGFNCIAITFVSLNSFLLALLALTVIGALHP